MVLIQSEYKYLKLFKNGLFWMAAKTNYFKYYQSLYTERFYATLEGHVIIDTGILNKIDNEIEYEICET